MKNIAFAPLAFAAVLALYPAVSANGLTQR
jgi:hypothetical protein